MNTAKKAPSLQQTARRAEQIATGWHRNDHATEPPVSHQTARLRRGRHSSPEEGVCVMELASMLAGEPFSDYPLSVCPVIAAFLRAYNDRLGDRWRQALYPYAAKSVGTRSTIAVERRRAEMCRLWTGRPGDWIAHPRELSKAPEPRGRLRSWLAAYRRASAGHHAGVTFGHDEWDYDGRKLDYELHRAALRFVDELIAEQGHDEPDPPVERRAVSDVESPGQRETLKGRQATER